MSYLTQEFCKKIQKKCIATAVQLLNTINETKDQNEIDNIKKKLVEINNIMKNIENYLSLFD